MFKTRQQEKFITLMENYSDAMSYAATATNSAGTAQEKYAAYSDSVEAAFNRLTASWEEFSQTVLDSNVIVTLIGFLANLADGLTDFMQIANGQVGEFVTVLGIGITTMLSLGVVLGILKSHLKDIGSVLTSLVSNPLPAALLICSLLVVFLKDASAEGKKAWGICLMVVAGIFLIAAATGHLGAVMSAHPFGAILALVSLLITGFTLLIQGINDASNANNKSREKAIESAKALQEEADALKEVADAAKEARDEIKSLSDEFKELGDEATAGDWYDTLEGIGENIASYYDESLAPLEAILKLLGNQYTYEELLNKTGQDRLDILKKLEIESAKLTKDAQSAAYDAQKTATDSMADALKRTANVQKGDEAWGERSRKEKKSAIDAASEIVSGIEGVSITRDGASAEISVDADSAKDYVEKLQEAVDAFKTRYAGNLSALNDNAVYQFLETSLAEAQASLDAQTAAAKDILESSAIVAGSGVAVNLDAENIKEEYDRVLDDMISLLASDTDVSKLVSDGLIAAEQLEAYAVDYLRKYQTELFNAANGITEPIVISFKSLNEAFEKTESKFDAIKNAMNEMKTAGGLSADTISSLSKEFPKLAEKIEVSKDGIAEFNYTLGEMFDLLSSTEKANVEAATQAYLAAVEAYNNLEPSKQTVEAYNEVIAKQNTLNEALKSAEYFSKMEAVRTRELLSDEYIDMLEKQTDELEEQSDAYSELCDIRKDLLNSYKEELDYQKKLQKQQKVVSDLRSRVSVAKLDTSAAGQARARELEAELREAEEELEDMTLEHAIDVLTAEIEASNLEYENFIQAEIEGIKDTINEAATLGADALAEKIKELGGDPTLIIGSENAKTALATAIQEGMSASKTEAEAAKTSLAAKQSAAQQAIYNAKSQENERALWKNLKEVKEYIDAGGDLNSLKGYVPVTVDTGRLGTEGIDGYTLTGWADRESKGDDIGLQIGNSAKVYDLVQGTIDISDDEKAGLNSVFKNSDGSMKVKNGEVVAYNGTLYLWQDSNGWRKVASDSDDVSEATAAYIAALTKKQNKSTLSTYHTGGLVGDASVLESNEEFAKLLKGEFVSTPEQMQRFMTETLPHIAGFTPSNATNEFNAPLIEIQCDNVTSEALPSLGNIVKEAVREVKKQLDNGMSRTGYKNTKTKLSI